MTACAIGVAVFVALAVVAAMKIGDHYRPEE